MPKNWQGRYEMTKVAVSDWDPDVSIATKEDVIANLSVALENNDAEYLLKIEAVPKLG
jgi:DNA-binding phage protein